MAIGIKDVFRLAEDAPSYENHYFLRSSLWSPFITKLSSVKRRILGNVTYLHGLIVYRY